MTIIEVATELNMIDTRSQWLFLISNPRKTNTSQLVTFIKEGGNVAIATNNTITDGNCSLGEECLYHELLKNFAMSLSKLVREEEAIYSQISDEEWESIRLTKRERRDSMLEFIKVLIWFNYKIKMSSRINPFFQFIGTIERVSNVQTMCQLEV